MQPSAAVYVTYVRKEDAGKAINAVDGSVMAGRILRYEWNHADSLYRVFIIIIFSLQSIIWYNKILHILFTKYELSQSHLFIFTRTWRGSRYNIQRRIINRVNKSRNIVVRDHLELIFFPSIVNTV